MRVAVLCTLDYDMFVAPITSRGATTVQDLHPDHRRGDFCGYYKNMKLIMLSLHISCARIKYALHGMEASIVTTAMYNQNTVLM